MFRRLNNSWELVKSSFEVLKADKELAVFPLISGLGVLLVTLLFAGPFLINGNYPVSHDGASLSTYLLVFFYYVVIYTVIIFSNSALVGAALMRMKGENPTLSDGIRIAFSHFNSILGYAIIAATVGMLLRWLAEKAGVLGKIFYFLADFAWNVLTFLVVPILVVEGIGPVEAIKRSANLLKKTWGEQLIGEIGISLFFGVVIFAVTVVFALLGVFSFMNGMTGIGVLLVALYIITLLGLVVLSSTLHSIYVAAVYKFAADGEVAGYFNENLLRNSFRRK